MEGLIPFDKERAGDIVLKIVDVGPSKASKEELDIFVMFLKARSNLPKADVELIKSQPGCVMTDDQISFNLTINCWRNYICDGCLAKSPETKLYLCKSCYITQYCSPQCQAKCREKHEKRCCKPDGPLDDGPQKIIFFKQVVRKS